MATNQRIVEKEIDQLLHLAVVPLDDWYEVMNGDGLSKVDRRIFNYTFEAFIAGSYDSAFKGFARLSTKGRSGPRFLDSSLRSYFPRHQAASGKLMDS